MAKGETLGEYVARLAAQVKDLEERVVRLEARHVRYKLGPKDIEDECR